MAGRRAMRASLYLRSANLVGDRFSALIDLAPEALRGVTGLRDLVFVSIREHYYRKPATVVRVSATTGREALRHARRALAAAERRCAR